MTAINKHAHTAHIYARAEKLLARALELGISKRGKPLNRDQAVELVSAEEGFRNRHVMDAALKSAAALPYPAREPVVDGSAEHMWRRLVQTQDWNEASQIIHLEGFIRDRGLLADFTVYAKRAAAMLTDAINLFEAEGYRVRTSHFNGSYWESPSGDEASDDFSSDEEAWLDLFRITGLKSGLDAHAFNQLSAPEQLNLVRLVLEADRGDAMRQATIALESKWGFEHPQYPRDTWSQEASAGDTKLGYWEWVQHTFEANGGEANHCTCCGIPRAADGNQALCNDCLKSTDERAAQVRDREGRFHRAIKGFLSPKEQGFTMGAFRSAMKMNSIRAQRQTFADDLAKTTISVKLKGRIRELFNELTTD